MRFSFLLTAWLAVTGIQVHAKDPIPVDPNVKIGKLPNGFTYFIRKSAEPAGKIYTRLVVRAGWLTEDEDQLGLAHLLEHVGCRGLQHFPKGIFHYTDSIGLQKGSEVNASTGNTTDYYFTIPSNKPKITADILQMLRDQAQGMLLKREEMDAERGAVLGEFRGGGTSEWTMELKEIEMQTYNHPEYSTSFRPRHNENIRVAKYETMVRFYNDWYRPNLQALVVVGDVDVAQIEQQIKALFSDMKNPANPRALPDNSNKYRVTLNGKNFLIKQTHAEITQITMQLMFKQQVDFDGIIRTREDYKREMLDMVYGKMIGKRMESAQEVYDPPFDHCYSGIRRKPFRKDAFVDAHNTHFGLKKAEDIERAFKAGLAVLERIKRFGFTAYELAEAKQSIEKDMKSRNEKTSSHLLGKYIEYFAHGAAAPDPDYEEKMIAELLKSITLKEVNAITPAWINSDTNRDVIIRANAKDSAALPTEADFNKWIAEVRAMPLQPYKDAVIDTKPLLTQKLPAATFKRTDIKEMGVTELALGNGVLVILKPVVPEHSSKKDEIDLTGYKPGGYGAYNDQDFFNSSSISGIISEAGAGRFDKFELKRYLGEKELSANVSIGKEYDVMSGRGDAPDLETILQLLYLNITAPRRDTASFSAWRKGIITRMDKGPVNSAQEFQKMMSKEMGHAAFRDIDSMHKLNYVTADQVYAMHKRHFSGFTNSVFFLVGDFDVEKAVPLLAKYLGALPAGGELKSVPEKIEPMKDSLRRDMFAGEAEGSNINVIYPGRYQYDVKTNMMLDILGKALNIKIWERLREKEKATYSPYGGSSYTRDNGGSYSFSIGYSVANDNVEPMIAAGMEEFVMMRDKGLDREMFEKSMTLVRESRKNDLKQAYVWNEYLKRKYYDKDPNPKEILEYDKILNSITIEDIKAAAAKYMKEDNRMIFTLQPASYGAKK